MQSRFESLANGLTLSNYDDWMTFDARLSDLVLSGQAKRVPTLKVLHMSDEEWYLDSSTGEVYVYVRPDDKVRPKWERVDVFFKIDSRSAHSTSEPITGNLDVNPENVKGARIDHGARLARRCILRFCGGRGDQLGRHRPHEDRSEPASFTSRQNLMVGI